MRKGTQRNRSLTLAARKALPASVREVVVVEQVAEMMPVNRACLLAVVRAEA